MSSVIAERAAEKERQTVQALGVAMEALLALLLFFMFTLIAIIAPFVMMIGLAAGFLRQKGNVTGWRPAG